MKNKHTCHTHVVCEASIVGAEVCYKEHAKTDWNGCLKAEEAGIRTGNAPAQAQQLFENANLHNVLYIHKTICELSWSFPFSTSLSTIFSQFWSIPWSRLVIIPARVL